MKSQRINRKNINSFCRTCLAEITKFSARKGQKFNIHLTPDVPRWIHACTSLEIDKSDGYPKFLCQNCYKNVHSLYEFREMSIRSKQTLDSLLNEFCIEPDIQKESAATKEEVCNDNTETYKTEQEKEETDAWLEFEMDDKSLIAPLLTSNFEIENFKKETSDTEVGDVCEGNLKDKEVFEYQNCSDFAIEGNNNKIISVANCLDIEIKIDRSHEQESSTDQANNFEIINAAEITNKSSVKKTSQKSSSALDVSTSPKEKLKFLCTQCSRRCLNQQNLDRHMRIHQGLKLFQCTECDRGFNKRSRLKDHVRRLHENHIEEEFQCTFEGCEKLFRKKESWRMHYRKKHTNYEETRQTYMCETCGSSFKNANSLKKHRFKHGPEEAYPFQCKQCGKRFLAKCKLQEHEMRHAGIKKFECPNCGMKKTTRNELRMHMNYHTKEKQWYCPYCTKVFNSSGNMNRHVVCVHKGERNYCCSYCDESFTKAESLKHHEMRHTGEKPHECQICGKRFIQRTALLTHLKTHEKNKKKIDRETAKTVPSIDTGAPFVLYDVRIS